MITLIYLFESVNTVVIFSLLFHVYFLLSYCQIVDCS